MRTVGLAKDCAQQQKWVRLPGLSLGGGSRDGSARPSPRCGRRVCRPLDAHDGMPHLQACTAEHAHAAVGDAPWVGDGIWLRAACQRALFRPSHVF